MLLGFFRMPASASLAHITEAAVPGVAGFAATFFSTLFLLNLLLGAFNLLPVPPLDGNSGITLLMSEEKALRFLDRICKQCFGIVGLVLAWVVYHKAFDCIFRFSLAALYHGSTWS